MHQGAEGQRGEGYERYAIVYPCAGVLAGEGNRDADGARAGNGDAGAPVAAGLRALLGAGRAEVLVLLARPLSTTQLTAVTGQGLGSVGRHLKVLREAGLVRRTARAGRSVLYARTAAGDVLVEGACG